MSYQIISVTDSNTGIEKDYEILYTFSSDHYDHDYIVMYEKDYNGDEVELHIVIFNDNELYSIDDEDEWNYAYEQVQLFLNSSKEN